MRQQIRFCTTPDGIRIAYAVCGKGTPLIWITHWVTHVEYDCQSPVWCHWIKELSGHNTLIRYDERGCGLSDHDVDISSLKEWVIDLETVVDALGIEEFDLFGACQGGAIAVAYAVKHPERVRRLVFLGAYARGRLVQERSREQVELDTSILNMVKLGWGRNNPAFRQVFTTLFMPEASEEQRNWFNDIQQRIASPENASRFLYNSQSLDVTNLAPQIRCPTLIMHSTGDAMVPLRDGRELASLIPGARFVPLASNNHILLETEPEWTRFKDEVHHFLNAAESNGRSHKTENDFCCLTPREEDVLDLIAQGRSNTEIAKQLYISPKTVRNHITNIFSKLEVKRRAEIIVRARDAGFGRTRITSNRP
jgi:pimeloyl-ACP methyl ester carboxylesterase/DNA-binding CsgD family transcriptional regulator